MQKISDEAFIAAWHKAGGSPKAVAEVTGLSIRTIYQRRVNLERRHALALNTTPERPSGYAPYAPPAHFVRRRKFEIIDGTAVVFSDPHWLPDHDTLGQTALEKVIALVKPQLIVCGGDALDGTQLSKWPVLSHHKTFSVREQLECVVDHFASIQKVAGKAQLAWTMGNHDVRLSRYVASQAEFFLDMPFTRLEDWVPAWPLSWTVEINSGQPGMTVIRHRNQPGMLHLQAVKAGCNYVHGHLHKLNVHRQPSFNGMRYSVDAGSLADPDSDAFDYAEGQIPHAQGFCVLTFKDGRLLPPELCEIVGGEAYFRGRTI